MNLKTRVRARTIACWALGLAGLLAGGACRAPAEGSRAELRRQRLDWFLNSVAMKEDRRPDRLRQTGVLLYRHWNGDLQEARRTLRHALELD